MKERQGAFPDFMIHDAMVAGWIQGVDEKNINPGSLDIAPTDEVYRIQGLPFPCPDEAVRDLLKKIGAAHHDTQFPLERGITYLARAHGTYQLPGFIYAYANPKSSSGRIRLRVRALADGVELYDSLPQGFSGEMWLSICPDEMPVMLSVGEALAQLRVCNADTRLDRTGIALMLDQYRLLWGPDGSPMSRSDVGMHDDSLILTINLHEDGWEGTQSNQILDLARRDARIGDFFRPVIRENGGVVRLRKNGFYIFRTYERVYVPPCLACEMRPLDARFGEFRSHFAGFIDPGWGALANPTLFGGGLGRPIVFEIIPYEDLVFRHRQPVARIRFEKMAEPPRTMYDELGKSNYNKPDHLLSKHFSKER